MSTDSFYLVDDRHLARSFSALGAQRVATRDEAAKALSEALSSCWLVSDATRLTRLLDVRMSYPRRASRCLLLLERADPQRLDLLGRLFDRIVTGDERFLQGDDLATALASPNRRDLLIGVEPIPEARTLLVYRGDLDMLVVPFSAIRGRRVGPKPDFDRARIVDGGQTIELGPFEVAADAVLYELDADYRRRAKAREIERDDSLGGSLRRLRLQRGMSREDFPGVSARTVARIERNETRPHTATLKKLAKRLRVAPEDIGSY